MWEASYGKEPFDLRLTVLRMMARWKQIVLFTLAGTLMLGGFYYILKQIQYGETQYKAESTYRIEYTIDSEKLEQAFITYINEYTWNTYIRAEEFLAEVQDYLVSGDWAELGQDELKAVASCAMESDWRVLRVTTVTENPEKSVAIAHAIEKTMTEKFSERISEVDSIRVIDSAGEAEEIVPDIRMVRAFILAAVLSLFFTLAVLLLKEIGADSLWLPATLRHRYGLKVLGTVESRDLSQNIKFFFEGKEEVALCTVQESINPVEVAEALKEKWERQLVLVPAPILCPESVEVLRKTSGIMLVVEAGEHAGKQLEYVLEFLEQQECKVTAVLLWNADERLLRNYYRFVRAEKQMPKE